MVDFSDDKYDKHFFYFWLFLFSVDSLSLIYKVGNGTASIFTYILVLWCAVFVAHYYAKLSKREESDE